MIRPLRKRHFQIWSLWALLLPALIVSAVLVRRPDAVTKNFGVQSINLLTSLIAEKKINGNAVQLRSDGVKRQLVWKNEKELATASAVIYLSPSGIAPVTASTYIGRIESRGDYGFNLPVRRTYYFIVYDFIHQMIIGRFELKEAFQLQTKSSPS